MLLSTQQNISQHHNFLYKYFIYTRSLILEFGIAEQCRQIMLQRSVKKIFYRILVFQAKFQSTF